MGSKFGHIKVLLLFCGVLGGGLCSHDANAQFLPGVMESPKGRGSNGSGHSNSGASPVKKEEFVKSPTTYTFTCPCILYESYGMELIARFETTVVSRDPSFPGRHEIIEACEASAPADVRRLPYSTDGRNSALNYSWQSVGDSLFKGCELKD